MHEEEKEIVVQSTYQDIYLPTTKCFGLMPLCLKSVRLEIACWLLHMKFFVSYAITLNALIPWKFIEGRDFVIASNMTLTGVMCELH